MICAAFGCSNEVPPREPGQSGRSRKYCLECKPPFQEDPEKIANRERIQELAAQQFRPLFDFCSCGRKIVVVGAAECAVCIARSKRAASQKARRKQAADAI